MLSRFFVLVYIIEILCSEVTTDPLLTTEASLKSITTVLAIRSFTLSVNWRCSRQAVKVKKRTRKTSPENSRSFIIVPVVNNTGIKSKDTKMCMCSVACRDRTKRRTYKGYNEGVANELDTDNFIAVGKSNTKYRYQVSAILGSLTWIRS